MTNKIKKQTLLGKMPNKKKPASVTQKRPVTQPQAYRPKTNEVITATAAQPKKSRKGIILFAIILLGFVMMPKPILITYQALGMVSQSVFWPGVFGHGAIVFDSSLSPMANLERDTLYLCRDKTLPSSCQKYQIIQQQGFFAALKKLISD
ncbi:hypothetical protein [Pseudoalteromonas mariniglutinosa]|uniref:hypothetical protein n=1 Tax=Pseudoalteromonas mariniglutinosa TaxID=206042 RepID=UPI00384DBB00